MDRQFYPHFKEFTIAVFLNKKTPAGWPNNRRIENSIDIALQRSGIGIGISDTSMAVSFKDQKGGFTVYSDARRTPGAAVSNTGFLEFMRAKCPDTAGTADSQEPSGQSPAQGWIACF